MLTFSSHLHNSVSVFKTVQHNAECYKYLSDHLECKLTVTAVICVPVISFHIFLVKCLRDQMDSTQA